MWHIFYFWEHAKFPRGTSMPVTHRNWIKACFLGMRFSGFLTVVALSYVFATGPVFFQSKIPSFHRPRLQHPQEKQMLID
jgi:hypothetical protein